MLGEESGPNTCSVIRLLRIRFTRPAYNFQFTQFFVCISHGILQKGIQYCVTLLVIFSPSQSLLSAAREMFSPSHLSLPPLRRCIYCPQGDTHLFFSSELLFPPRVCLGAQTPAAAAVLSELTLQSVAAAVVT